MPYFTRSPTDLGRARDRPSLRPRRIDGTHTLVAMPIDLATLENEYDSWVAGASTPPNNTELVKAWASEQPQLTAMAVLAVSPGNLATLDCRALELIRSPVVRSALRISAGEGDDGPGSPASIVGLQLGDGEDIEPRKFAPSSPSFKEWQPNHKQAPKPFLLPPSVSA